VGGKNPYNNGLPISLAQNTPKVNKQKLPVLEKPSNNNFPLTLKHSMASQQ
jgi:hypothetical protein